MILGCLYEELPNFCMALFYPFLISRDIHLLNSRVPSKQLNSDHHMGQNKTGQNLLRSSCVKMRKPVFGTFRRVDPSVSSKARVSHAKPAANEILVENATPSDANYVKNVRFSETATKKDHSGKKLVDQKTFGELKFDSFIRQTKAKMSAPSDVGVMKTVTRRDTFHEKVSNFIDRAKLKFRATSSMGAKWDH
ncbi:hypothetical protein Hanom_Chr11g01024101 [Helianthus anomalus]